MRWGVVAAALAVALCSGSARSASSPWADVALVWVHADRHGQGVLWGMHADGRGERSLGIQVCACDETRWFSWSPDGHLFAFVDGHGVLVADTRDGSATRVPGSTVCEGHVSLAAHDRLLCSGGESGDRVYVVERGHATEVESDEGAGDQTISGAVWGRRNVVAASWDTGDLALFIAKPRWHQVGTAPGSGYNPAWSPDGRRLAFDESRDDSTRTGVWVTRVGGLKARRVGVGLHPSFSPDGGWIAFDRAGEIFVMRANGTDVRQVTHRPGTDEMPLWRPR